MNVARAICAGSPASFCSVELDDFTSLVLAGGEVAPIGLRGRVERAVQLAFARETGCLVGVAGLKRPSDSHRNDVSKGAIVPLSAADYPFELGWVFILPSARGNKHSRPLCEPLVQAANGNGVFATSRAENKAMHATLVKLGFSRSGSAWPSTQVDENLLLFLKMPPNKSLERTRGE